MIFLCVVLRRNKKYVIQVGNKTDKLREGTHQQLEVECRECDQEPGAKYLLRLKNEDPRIAALSHGDITQASPDIFH